MALKFIEKILTEKSKTSTEKSLIEVLIKSMGKYYEERSYHTVHASDVTKPDFCARKIRLLDYTGIKQPDTYISTALRATFDIGSMVADKLVEQWMGERAHGHWECSSCGLKSSFGPKPVDTCKVPGTCNWKHKEVNFFGETSHISGSIDLIANLGGIKLKVVELKTMKPDDFDKLAAPLAEHRLRTRLYLQLIADSNNPIRYQLDTDSAKILYVSKGFGKMNAEHGQYLPFREFDVARDDDSIKEYLQNGLDVKAHRHYDTIPTKKSCDSIACKQAKACPVKSYCWSGEYK